MKRDLGRAGEKKFASWCSDVGITINKAEEDKHGWDFLLELPVNRATGSAIDLHKSNVICKVQVKATEGKKLSKSIELSNLHALATDPLPVFYLFIHFSSDATPVEAYLLHLDGDIIRRILKLAREHISAGEGKRLHKKTLTLNYDERHRLPEASGCGFLKYIELNYYGCWGRLLSAKQEVLATAGFEDGVGTINFTITGEEQRKNLILGSLGYANQVAVSDFSVWNKRFGIKDPKPVVVMAEAMMTMTRAGYIETKVMITCSAVETLIMPAKVYFSPLVNDLSKAIFRISTDFIDMRADAGSGEIKVDSVVVDYNFYSLTLLRKVLIFFEKTITSRQNISVFFEHQGNYLRIFNAHTNPHDKAIERLSVLADCLRDVLKDSFDVSSVAVSPDWLRVNSGALQSILNLKRGRGRFSVNFKLNEVVDCDVPMRAHFFHYQALAIGAVCYVFLFAAQCARFQDEDGKYGFSGEFKLIKEIEGPNSESWVEEFLASEGASLIDEIIAVGDMYCDDYWSELSSTTANLMVRMG